MIPQTGRMREWKPKTVVWDADGKMHLVHPDDGYRIDRHGRGRIVGDLGEIERRIFAHLTPPVPERLDYPWSDGSQEEE